MISKINTLFICFILIIQSTSLSLRKKVTSLDVSPKQKAVANFIKKLVKENVDFKKRETDEALIYEIWVYHNKGEPEEVVEKVNDVVEELT